MDVPLAATENLDCEPLYIMVQVKLISNPINSFTKAYFCEEVFSQLRAMDKANNKIFVI